MKKVLAMVLAMMLCLALIPAMAEAAPVKVGVLVPVMTHGWVSGITYQAEAYAKELAEAGKIEYRLTTSSNAEEMTTQIDEAILWGAQILVIAPQWTGMEVPVQNAIDQGITVVAFDMDIDAGEGLLLQYGRAIPITWDQQNGRGFSFYDAEDGSAVKLLPGRTIIQVISPDRKAEYTLSGGGED